MWRKPTQHTKQTLRGCWGLRRCHESPAWDCRHRTSSSSFHFLFHYPSITTVYTLFVEAIQPQGVQNPPKTLLPPLLQTCSLVATSCMTIPHEILAASIVLPPPPPAPPTLPLPPLLPSRSTVAARSLQTPSLKTDGLSPANPLDECCNMPATNSLK